jgi:hypothetical protein
MGQDSRGGEASRATGCRGSREGAGGEMGLGEQADWGKRSRRTGVGGEKAS